MFSFHWPELVVILILALALFGPKRLPELGEALGKGLNQFRKVKHDIEHETGLADIREMGKKEIAELRDAGRIMPKEEAKEELKKSE